MPEKYLSSRVKICPKGDWYSCAGYMDIGKFVRLQKEAGEEPANKAKGKGKGRQGGSTQNAKRPRVEAVQGSPPATCTSQKSQV